MNAKVKWLSLALGAAILMAILILPAARKYAWAHRSVDPATPPPYTANVATAPGTTSPGAYGSQNTGNYWYGMMSWMLGPNWGGYREGSGNPPQGNYWGMMGGYRGYPGQTGEPSQGQQSGQPATIELSIHPDAKLGPDGKKHDAYTPADWAVKQGTPVLVTIYNYDNTPHSFTAPSLGLNIQAAPASADGSPGVTRFSFTPAQAGNFVWQCVDPCDTQANGWAMSNDGYMLGTIQVKA